MIEDAALVEARAILNALGDEPLLSRIASALRAARAPAPSGPSPSRMIRLLHIATKSLYQGTVGQQALASRIEIEVLDGEESGAALRAPAPSDAERVWSRERPSEPGWYWLDGLGSQVPMQPVRVFSGLDELRVVLGDGSRLLSWSYFNNALWLPIPDPPEVTP